MLHAERLRSLPLVPTVYNFSFLHLAYCFASVHDVGNIHNFCLTDDDCLKKKDNDGDPIRIRKANLSDVSFIILPRCCRVQATTRASEIFNSVYFDDFVFLLI